MVSALVAMFLIVSCLRAMLLIVSCPELWFLPSFGSGCLRFFCVFSLIESMLLTLAARLSTRDHPSGVVGIVGSGRRSALVSVPGSRYFVEETNAYSSGSSQVEVLAILQVC